MLVACGLHGELFLISAGPISMGVIAPDSLVLQRVSRVERVTGIEPALSAWEPTSYPDFTVAERMIGLCADTAWGRD